MARPFVLAALLAFAGVPATAAPLAERLREAEEAGAAARERADRLSGQARSIEDRALRSRMRARALAARIAEAEVRLETAQLREAQAMQRRAVLRQQIARRHAPLSRLLAGLLMLARRPAMLAVLRPDSLRHYVRTRVMIDALAPQIAAHSASLRGQLAAMDALAARAATARAQAVAARSDLADRRAGYRAIAARERLAFETLSIEAGAAAREAKLRVAEARSISALLAQDRENARLERRLAALPVPHVGRENGTVPAKPAGARRPLLPVDGRLLAGFGERDAAGGRSRGLTIAPAANATVRAPLPGTVLFASPWRGYGRVVIIRHRDGLVSTIAGLSSTSVAANAKISRGTVLGRSATENPRILYELRRNGDPVHPLLP